VKRDGLFLAVVLLCTPIARPSVFIKEHGKSSLVCATGRPEGAALESPFRSVKIL
jgi:hypothetical protein